ncbi:hypothetical protein, partial [Tautonia rosea]|uniref:hypothetical protein n=1 Tax=Tautonia rosea TaxID=2728037 RepID=UPI0014752144
MKLIVSERLRPISIITIYSLRSRHAFLLGTIVLFLGLTMMAQGNDRSQTDDPPSHRLWSKAHAVPAETTSEQSGYVSLFEGTIGRINIGTTRHGVNASLAEFNPQSSEMSIVVDAHRAIGTNATGFAVQAKIHTRYHVGESGRIDCGTKQSTLQVGERLTDSPGGYQMVDDPATRTTHVDPIPLPHHGIINVTPNESRGLASISTCSNHCPVEQTHFLVLNLETGESRDVLDCRHMSAFIVVDHLGLANHPILGGEIAWYPRNSETLVHLQQIIDGQPPTEESLLAHPDSHPINWDNSPDRKTFFAVPRSGNQWHAYNLTTEGDTLRGRSLDLLIAGAESTDCRALCVGPDGSVWAGFASTRPGEGSLLRVVRDMPGDRAPSDLGPIATSNPDDAAFMDDSGQVKPDHHDVHRLDDGTLVPRFLNMGIATARVGTVALTTLYPFTLHAIQIPPDPSGPSDPESTDCPQSGNQTTISDPSIPFTVSESPYVILRRGEIEAVIVDNQAVDDDVLPGHRAGYNGLAALRHSKRTENLFVPTYSG